MACRGGRSGKGQLVRRVLDVGLWLLFFALLMPAGFVGYVIGKEQASDEPAADRAAPGRRRDTGGIEAAPAFSADELPRSRRDGWLTNGGTLLEPALLAARRDRHRQRQDAEGRLADPPRRLRHRGEVLGRGAADRLRRRRSTSPPAPTTCSPSTSTPAKILWEYEANLDQKITTVCCGWSSRGVAIGDGKVYVGQLDGKLVALDQKTGKVVWATQVGRWQEGYTITARAALLRRPRRSPASPAASSRSAAACKAYDAKTGKLVWRFYTIPGPGELGHDTWPQDNDAWKHGGAPVWQTPAVDPELGLLYFSTGNAGARPQRQRARRRQPLHGVDRRRSTPKTGKYRWHFQQVHHDIWDYDSPEPGRAVRRRDRRRDARASRRPAKTGWVYILDRETGKPLLAIDEKPVPQEPRRRPRRRSRSRSYRPFFSHEVTDDGRRRDREARATGHGEEPCRVQGAQEIYTPFREEITVDRARPAGRHNWQPIELQPGDGDVLRLRACGRVSGYSSRSETTVPRGSRARSPTSAASSTTTGFGDARRATSRAIDATHRRDRVAEALAGVVLLGLGHDRRRARLRRPQRRRARGVRRRRPASPLWSFQTGAGANSTVTIFEQDGTQYVAFVAGGNALAATPHGDNLWLFSLDGTMDEVAGRRARARAPGTPARPPRRPRARATPRPARRSSRTTAPVVTASTARARTAARPDRERRADADAVRAQVTNGGGGMPAFKGTLSEQQIEDVASYVTERIAKNGG